MLWDHSCKSCWPSDQAMCKCLLGDTWWQLERLGLQNSVQAHFWEEQLSCSKAKGVYKGHVPWPTYPEIMSVAFKYVVILKYVLLSEVLGQVNAVFHMRVGLYFGLLSLQCSGGTNPSRTVTPMFQTCWDWNHSLPWPQSQVLKGHPCEGCTYLH